ncbi:hypothetical protein HPP92_027745 [Vanilla planifolia]|uniref:Uncharacterized protein n=1 Tax=Vanilla planifolia TaxID=51239 RepID=A0A835PA00_VANPL|nr:hypothetical protein HPP92_027745 [Vanilla planifolia]
MVSGDSRNNSDIVARDRQPAVMVMPIPLKYGDSVLAHGGQQTYKEAFDNDD